MKSWNVHFILVFDHKRAIACDRRRIVGWQLFGTDCARKLALPAWVPPPDGSEVILRN